MGYGPSGLWIQLIAAIVGVFSNGGCKHVAAHGVANIAHHASTIAPPSNAQRVKAGNNGNGPMATTRLIGLYLKLQPTVIALTVGKIQYAFTERQAAS